MSNASEEFDAQEEFDDDALKLAALSVWQKVISKSGKSEDELEDMKCSEAKTWQDKWNNKAYQGKLEAVKRETKKEKQEVKEVAKRHKPQVLNVLWIDGLALEREAFNKGIFFFEQTLFLFPKTWASRKLALENVIGAFRN